MRLRFREEHIKRLQACASESLSDIHLQQEIENLSKEIEIFRNQLDRNPEITRFAMENLQVREELRRYVLILLTLFLCYIFPYISNICQNVIIFEDLFFK